MGRVGRNPAGTTQVSREAAEAPGLPRGTGRASVGFCLPQAVGRPAAGRLLPCGGILLWIRPLCLPMHAL